MDSPEPFANFHACFILLKNFARGVYRKAIGGLGTIYCLNYGKTRAVELCFKKPKNPNLGFLGFLILLFYFNSF